MVRYCPPYQRPMAFAATLTPPKELDQLVPEDPRILDCNYSIPSGRPMAMPFEPSMPPMHISSPGMYNQAFDTEFSTTHADGDIAFPRLETLGVIPAPTALVSSSPSIGPAVQVYVPPMWGNSEGEQTLPNAESDSASESLPLRKLEYGVWKCMICGQKLRRKQRAVVHYWSKHSDVRLTCAGRCGSVHW